MHFTIEINIYIEPVYAKTLFWRNWFLNNSATKFLLDSFYFQ